MDGALRQADTLQRLVAKLIATSPVGVKLLLIGGFRYRLLDNSHRLSVDIDYHWDGDLGQKQDELLNYCKRVVLKEVKRTSGYDGSASRLTGPGADAPNVASVVLRFWNAESSVEIPIDVTKIVCLDPSTVRTANGAIHATASDADLIEGKIMALFNRPYLQHRDFVDIWLYGDRLLPDSPERVTRKISVLGMDPEAVRKNVQGFDEHADSHAKHIQEIIDTQVDPTVTDQINAGGGGRTVLAESLKFIKRVCPS